MQLPINKVVIGVIVLVVLALGIYIFIVPYSTSKGTFISLIDKVMGNEPTIPKPSELKDKTFVADNFLKEVQSCLKSNEVDCYCPFTNTFISEGMQLVFRNTGEGKSTFGIFASSEDACSKETALPVKAAEDLNGVNFYVEDTYSKPSINNNKLDHNDFSKATGITLAKSKMCSEKDVAGWSNSIDFTLGIIYKLDKTNIAFTRSQPGLKRCAPAQETTVGAK